MLTNFIIMLIEMIKRFIWMWIVIISYVFPYICLSKLIFWMMDSPFLYGMTPDLDSELIIGWNIFLVYLVIYYYFFQAFWTSFLNFKKDIKHLNISIFNFILINKKRKFLFKLPLFIYLIIKLKYYFINNFYLINKNIKKNNILILLNDFVKYQEQIFCSLFILIDFNFYQNLFFYYNDFYKINIFFKNEFYKNFSFLKKKKNYMYYKWSSLLYAKWWEKNNIIKNIK